MASLNEFSRRIAVRGQKIADNADRMVRRVALAADQAVVSSTPVDTGRARSNWLVQMNSPATDVREPYAPGEKGTTKAQNTSAATDQAEAVVAQYRGGDEIHITNNLPYIQRLNDGSSAQTPANFVETAVQSAVDAVTKRGRITE